MRDDDRRGSAGTSLAQWCAAVRAEVCVAGCAVQPSCETLFANGVVASCDEKGFVRFAVDFETDATVL